VEKPRTDDQAVEPKESEQPVVEPTVEPPHAAQVDETKTTDEKADS
jgi:hypothetical protein